MSTQRHQQRCSRNVVTPPFIVCIGSRAKSVIQNLSVGLQAVVMSLLAVRTFLILVLGVLVD
jgi:hypothetical protein